MNIMSFQTMPFKLVNTLMCITGLVLCYLADVDGQGAPAQSSQPPAAAAAAVRRERRPALLAAGSERADPSAERRPLSPSDLATSPTPLPLRPTIETVTSHTLKTVPSTSSSPITDPSTTTTTTPVPTTTNTAAPNSFTAVSTTGTTTLAPTVRHTSEPTTSANIPPDASAPVPPSSPSDGTSPAAAAPNDVCAEMGLMEYEWEEVTDQCYRFHAYGAAWPAANATCAAEGTALAVANSREEAALFSRLLLRHLKTGIRDAAFKGAVALGFYWDQDWKTVHGTPLEDTGYSKWWAGWPRDPPRAPWGFMEHSGRLENYVGTLTTPFICEALR